MIDGGKLHSTLCFALKDIRATDETRTFSRVSTLLLLLLLSPAAAVLTPITGPELCDTEGFTSRSACLVSKCPAFLHALISGCGTECSLTKIDIRI